jgi:hypothetical protein
MPRCGWIAAVLTLLLASSLAGRAQTPLPAGQATTPGPPTGGTSSDRPVRDGSQMTSAGNAVLRGRVVSADTGQPIRRAIVRVMGQAQPRLALTDDQGHYQVTRLPAGKYQLEAARGGYVTVQYGQRRPFSQGRPITVTDGQVIDRLDFAMPRAGVIAGRIFDEIGEPVTRAQLRLWRWSYMNGRRQLVSMSGGSSDDRGEFRLFDVSPGEYYVSASLDSGFGLPEDRLQYARTYYPGTLSPRDAQRVTVGVGEEISGITFSLVLARTATISGTVRSSNAISISPAVVIARTASEEWGGVSEPQMGITQPDGSFTIGGLSPGEYILEARRVIDPSDGEYGSTRVFVDDGEVDGVLLLTTPARSARGRIRFDTGRVPPDVHHSQVRVFAVDPEPWGGLSTPGDGRVRDDWTFELTGLFGQRHLLAFSMPPWTVKSVVVDGRDVTDTPIHFANDVDDIELTLTQQTTSLSGGVTDARGQQVGDAFVVVFADDPEKWGPRTRFIQTARPDQAGRFTISGLPPGRYVAIAVEHLEPGEERDPELLDIWRSWGVPVTLRESESRTLDLRLSNF